MLQTILVPKKYFTKNEAISWIKDNYKFNKMDEKDNFYRFRQSYPIKNMKFYTKKLPNNIELVYQY